MNNVYVAGPIPRKEFAEAWWDVWCNGVWDNLPYQGESFAAWWGNDTYFLCDEDSGVVVTWYKHLGRSVEISHEITAAELQGIHDRFMEELQSSGYYRRFEEATASDRPRLTTAQKIALNSLYGASIKGEKHE